MGDITINTELTNAFKEKNIDYFQLHIATPQEFFDAIGKAKVTNPYGTFVTQHTIEEYSNMCLLLTDDGTAGIAITKDKNIVSLFNGGVRRGVMKTLLPTAIKLGGRKLDNFNSAKLSSMYEMYGFWPISQTGFNTEFAPSDWNYSRDGYPDIVFWIHNGDTAEDVILNLGTYDVSWDNVVSFDSYEAAEQFRDAIIDEIDRIESSPATNA